MTIFTVRGHRQPAHLTLPCLALGTNERTTRLFRRSKFIQSSLHHTSLIHSHTHRLTHPLTRTLRRIAATFFFRCLREGQHPESGNQTVPEPGSSQASSYLCLTESARSRPDRTPAAAAASIPHSPTARITHQRHSRPRIPQISWKITRWARDGRRQGSERPASSNQQPPTGCRSRARLIL